MLLRSAISASALALTAQAFLIPPSISSSIDQDASNLLINPESPTQRVVKLDCPTCLYGLGPSGLAERRDSHLVMKFSVEPSNGVDTLYLNGVQLYPLPAQPRHDIPAVQVAAAVDDDEQKNKENVKSAPVALGTHTTISPIHHGMVFGAGEVMTLELKVKTVDDMNVDGVPVVKTTFFRTGGANGSGGKLMIARVETVKEGDSHRHHLPNLSPMQTEKTGGAQQCTSVFPVLCRVRAIIVHKFHKAKSALKGCHRRVRLGFMRTAYRPSHHRVHPHHHDVKKIQTIDPFAAMPHMIRPHHPSHHDMDNSHMDAHKQPSEMMMTVVDHTRTPHHAYQPMHSQFHHRHSFVHTIRRIYIHVLVPVFIGIAAGMTASLVGLVIGQLVIVLWRRFFRRGDASAAAAYTGVIQLDDDEKQRFLSGYEDVSTMTNMGVGVHVVERE
ncbi:MAG: hypothetical protein M1816_006592 [Peltula sp. TS41687]|nr:MAG: hypothetical protein M1816_006592 [Peltula sp. TS41687]